MTVSIQNSEKLHAHFKIQYSVLNIFKIQYFLRYFLRLSVKRRRNSRFCFRTSLLYSCIDDKEFHRSRHDFWETFWWQFSYLLTFGQNPRDGGAWWAAVYGVTWSRTRLRRLSSSSSSTDITLCYKM